MPTFIFTWQCDHRVSKADCWRCTNNNVHLFRYVFSHRPSRLSLIRTRSSALSQAAPLRSPFTHTIAQHAVKILRDPLSHVSLQKPAHPLSVSAYTTAPPGCPQQSAGGVGSSIILSQLGCLLLEP
ncbi:hypothetical protein ElyMa_000041500 [Elysia marginata]|uniref:Uncharacterized protein n=1 Tax=Elysia marginata TaxID=1093978 RepID=A0AAV4ECY2_9GAST|nr:hypothetical protein ElyMa_000041500 [Elysia marginata]